MIDPPENHHRQEDVSQLPALVAAAGEKQDPRTVRLWAGASEGFKLELWCCQDGQVLLELRESLSGRGESTRFYLDPSHVRRFLQMFVAAYQAWGENAPPGNPDLSRCWGCGENERAIGEAFCPTCAEEHGQRVALRVAHPEKYVRGDFLQPPKS